MTPDASRVVTVPRRFRLERRQSETFPYRLRPLHELTCRQCDWRESALQQRINEHSRAFAIVARATRAVARIFVLQDFHIVLRLAAI